MSEQSKRERRERRSAEQMLEGAGAIMAKQPGEVWLPEAVPMSRVFELRAMPGGYAVIVADVPRSALEVVSESPADILPIALAKIDDAISAHASKGVAG
jgi:hypothetical protein